MYFFFFEGSCLNLVCESVFCDVCRHFLFAKFSSTEMTFRYTILLGRIRQPDKFKVLNLIPNMEKKRLRNEINLSNTNFLIIEYVNK